MTERLNPVIEEETTDAETFDGTSLVRPRFRVLTPSSEGQMPDWRGLGLSYIILRRLCDKAFTSPTPIQKQSLPLALSGRDVIGISQTGSGKTLAFALPIINYILSQPPLSRTHKRSLSALIIAPTRELALQVSTHITECSPVRTEKQIKAHDPPRISVATIVGGMSSHKQLRVLEKGADIIVATPGRLWELLSEVRDPYFNHTLRG